MVSCHRLRIAFLFVLAAARPASAQESAISSPPPGETRTIARCGKGYLELVNGYRVLHLKGTPYEMGFQQGTLLRDHIRGLVRYLFDVKAKEFQKELKVNVAGLDVTPDPRGIIAGIARGQREFIPPRFFEELKGVADGAEMDEQDIIVANFIPEMFHCSGFALAGKATRDGTLYHGRVLDYGVDWRLQDHAVVTVAEPDGKLPFVNVTFAGFVGCVTGMNARSVSIGEMGGGGLGHWAGVPMALLVRMALEEAGTLDEAVSIFRDSPRTCEYYYVIADGKIGKAVGMEASWHQFRTVDMGESHPLLPRPVEDAVLLSAGERYDRLVDRVEREYGKIDAAAAIHLMDRPVAMKSNLHNVLFEPASTRFWVANASTAGEPAATQTYYPFQFNELLARSADQSAPEVGGDREPAGAAGGSR